MEQKRLNIKELLKNSIPIIIFIALMGILTLICMPYIQGLATEEGRAEFKAWIDSIGFVGWLITLAIQLLQIFVAFIPGEPVELMLGYVWGPWLGTLTCLIGIFIGTLVIFLMVVDGVVDTVVGDTALWVVIGTNLCRTVTCRYHCLTL